MPVPMHIQGSPISFSAASETHELQERFWYWRGASGQNYIHSVYEPENCPPLPGAVYVGVKRSGAARIAMVVGRFAPFWEKAMPSFEQADFRDCDEVHVHLLARNPGAAEGVRLDLMAALGDEWQPTGLQEQKSAYWSVAA
jgi:hypothetical protein